jgi:hypothetical protein
MLLSLTAFSQTVTKNYITDSIVPLPKFVAKEVAKDLIRKDSLLTELAICKSNSDLLNENLSNKDKIISSKDSIISIYGEKEKNWFSIIELKDLQKKNLEELTKKLTHDLKMQKIKMTVRSSLGLALIGVLTYIIVK